MFISETYTLNELVAKFALPAKQVELGLRRTGARTLRDEDNQEIYNYDSVWRYVHQILNRKHFAAWEHDVERVRVSEMTDSILDQLTGHWPGKAREGLLTMLKSVNGSSEVCLLRYRLRRIDPECPLCGCFPWIVGFDGRQAEAGTILGIYVCPACGYLFLKR